MTPSIIEESKKAQKKGILSVFQNKKLIAPAVIAGLVIISYFLFFSGDQESQAEDQVQEWTVIRDDLKISIESDGKVVAEDGVELSFSVSGDTLEVEEIYIKEGDRVQRGDKIASVKTNSLEFDLRSAYASYQSALANLNSRQVGPTEEEKAKALASIDQAEVFLDQAKISLEKIKTSAEKNIASAESFLATAENNLKLNQDENSSTIVNDAYQDLINTIRSTAITAESSLEDSDSIIGVDNRYVNDDFENLLGAKHSQSLSDAEQSYSIAKQAKLTLDTQSLALSTSSAYEDIDTAASQAETTLNNLEQHLYDMKVLLEATVTSVDLTQSELDSFKSTISSDRSSTNSASASLTNSIQAVNSAKNSVSGYEINYQKALTELETAKKEAEQDIANAKSNVTAKEISLRQAQIGYEDLIAPVPESDLASYRASLTFAAINVDKAKYSIEQATLISPIEGQVAILNYKTGDIINRDDNKPMAIIINNDTLFIEVKVEEAEINKIKVGQKAIATFDAVEELELTGEISFISLTSETDNNGVVTYLIRMVFSNTKDSQIREGMTAFVEFITAGVEDILVAPVDAVRNVRDQPSVQLVSGEWIPVTTGFTDGEMVELVSGLEEGTKIITNSDIQQTQDQKSSGSMAEMFTEEERAQIKEMSEEERTEFLKSKGVDVEALQTGGGMRVR